MYCPQHAKKQQKYTRSIKNIRNKKYSKTLEGYKGAGGYQTLKKVFDWVDNQKNE